MNFQKLNQPLIHMLPRNKRITLIAFITLLMFQSCDRKQEETKNESPVEFNQKLQDELRKMAEIDQIAAYIPQGKYKEMTNEEWNSFKDSVFTTHQLRLKEIFDKHGFVGFDLAGEEGSFNFWLMVQHSDHNPDFQGKVLADMRIKMEKRNASKRNYAYLTDRVNKNLGKKIIYGTQVSYNEYGQAISRPLEDSANVNERRAEVGLESIEEYLNRMTVSHFEMNKENMLKKGITEPKLYKVPNE